MIVNEIVTQIIVHATKGCYYDSSFLNSPSFFKSANWSSGVDTI